jgi:UDP-galactose transporter B1
MDKKLVKDDPQTNAKSVLRTGDMNRSYLAYIISLAGIMVSFILMSIVSEKSVKTTINGEKFQYPEIRLLIAYLFAFVASSVMRFVNKEDISMTKFLHPIYKNENYIISSVALFFSMEFVIMSSMNINYILHILLRSSKFFSVLFFNFIIRSKENKISSKQLMMGFFFTIGVVLFSFSGSKKNEQATSLFGIFCAFTAFVLDGIVSYFQGKTRNNNMPHVSSFCFMQMTNFWCLLVAILHSFLNRSFVPGFTLLFQHPDFLLMMVTMALMSVIGQFFTFDHINRFGPVSLSLVNTVRKICSILLSIIIYNHSMTEFRIAGISIICAVLVANSFGMELIKMFKRIVYKQKKD